MQNCFFHACYLMDHCAICLDDGSIENPLVKPCSKCSLMTHKRCMLNIISTNLITKRMATHKSVNFLTNEAVITTDEGTFINYGGEKLLDTNAAFCTVPRSINYYKFLQRGGICSPMPNFHASAIFDTIFYHDFGKDTVVLIDKCLQCKRDIKAEKKSNRMFFFDRIVKSLKLDVELAFIMQTLTAWKVASKELIDMRGVVSHFIEMFATLAAVAPWLFLHRNLKDFKEVFEQDPMMLPFKYYDLYFLAYSPTSATLWYTFPFHLLILGSRNNSFTRLFRKIMLIVKMLSNKLLYSVFNLLYLNLAIETQHDRLILYVEHIDPLFEYKVLNKRLTFQDKWNIVQQRDIKLMFEEGAIRKSSSTVDYKQPINSLMVMIFGPLIGNNIYGKCKPLVKSIYKLFSSFGIVPVEVEMVIEYLGFQTVLFLKEVYEYFSLYYKLKSIEKFKPVQSKLRIPMISRGRAFKM